MPVCNLSQLLRAYSTCSIECMPFVDSNRRASEFFQLPLSASRLLVAINLLPPAPDVTSSRLNRQVSQGRCLGRALFLKLRSIARQLSYGRPAAHRPVP